MKYLLTFDDPAAVAVERTGGKGANLSALTQRGFNVPAGFVVTASAYRDFLVGNPNILAKVPQLSFHDSAALREESDRLRAALKDLPLPSELVTEISEQLSKHASAQAYSVRSSSTMEDLANAAFAGQHDTFLNTIGVEQILARIKDCFLSLWHDRAVAYRHQQKFDHSQAAMAVVVQRMVQCDVAGVGFSVNPVGGDLSEMVIDANYGLGESVVSGDGCVDHFEIDKAKRTVRCAVIAKKEHKVVSIAGGTGEVVLAEAEANQACLDETQLAELTDLLLKVEQSFRFPQDIEWGFAEGKLHLLQSRPITAIPARWTRDESAERFPNVIAPLTWDFVDNGFHRSLVYSFHLMGFPAYHGKWFGMIDHYIYGNQNVVDLYLKRAPFVVRSPDELKALIPRLREEFAWVQELPLIWNRELDFYLTRIGGFMAEPLEGKSMREVWEYVLRINETGAQYFQPNIAISITHAMLHHMLHRLLQMVCGADANRLFDGLMAFCETKTGTINKELYEMARMVREVPELEALLLKRASREIVDEKLLDKFPAFQTRLQKFLRDHGHREMDFDMYHATWLEVPWVVLDNIRLIVQSPIDRTPAQKEHDLKRCAQQAETELFRKLPDDLHYFFHEVLRLARVYTSLDDMEHYQTTRLALPLRRGLREMGGRLVAKKILTEPLDIFFARWKQIDEALDENSDVGWVKFGEAVRQQKTAYLADKARKPVWTIGASGGEAEPDGASSLSGLAGSTGVAEGAVWLVLNEEDFARFPKGSVLVARTTNPTWTPLFYSAVAVVTESGGPLSHGAVTAREMKIPAVMSVRESLSKLKNGQRVRVDGGAGKVFLV